MKIVLTREEINRLEELVDKELNKIINTSNKDSGDREKIISLGKMIEQLEILKIELKERGGE